jgi:hypothetical protein
MEDIVLYESRFCHLGGPAHQVLFQPKNRQPKALPSLAGS